MGNTPSGIPQAGSGFQTGTNTVSRATKIVKFFVPGKDFTRSYNTRTTRNRSKKLTTTSCYTRIVNTAQPGPVMSDG